MKSMEIGSKQKQENMLTNSFGADVSFFISFKHIICFNFVVFSNFAMSDSNMFVSTLNLITLRTYFFSFLRKKFNDSFFAPCLEHKLVF